MKTSKFLTYCEKDLEERLLEITKYKNETTPEYMKQDVETTKLWLKCISWQRRILTMLREQETCLHEHVSCPEGIKSIRCAYCGKNLYKLEGNK